MLTISTTIESPMERTNSRVVDMGTSCGAPRPFSVQAAETLSDRSSKSEMQQEISQRKQIESDSTTFLRGWFIILRS